MTSLNVDRIRLDENFRLLSIAYYISAGVGLFSGVIGLISMFIWGIAMLAVGAGVAAEEEAAGGIAFILMFLVIGTAVGLWMLLSLGFQVLKIFAGRKLARGESGFLVMTVAILSLLSFPLGTVIGIWTLFATSRKQALDTAEAHVPAHPVGG